MTEGPRTWSWAMEEQLAAINERQEFLLNKLETFSSSVHQHTELFDIVKQSLTAQQTVMTELMVNLTHLEWPPFSPPLLPSPSTLSIQPRSITYHPTMTLAPPTPHQSLPLNLDFSNRTIFYIPPCHSCSENWNCLILYVRVSTAMVSLVVFYSIALFVGRIHPPGRASFRSILIRESWSPTVLNLTTLHHHCIPIWVRMFVHLGD